MAQPDALQQRLDLLINAIQRRIDPVTTPIRYKLAMLLAATIMVILPLIYVSIAFMFAAVVYFHMVNSIGIFSQVRGKGVILAAIVYFGPLIAGGTAVLFMFKPLFSRAPKKDKPTSLDREKEPILFEFVDKLCDSVHAPRPKRIDVDSQVNASASFRRGALSMLLGNDLVLTVGMPLVSGMSLRQFSGVLAHEFGHFAQGGGMRLSYIIRTISMWFTRVVYERDTWDENLEQWSRENDIRIGIIFYLARGCVWLTRRILWVLMMVGNGVSGILLRQMEFDADRHMVRFSGSDVIEPSTRRLHELMIASEMAYSDLDLAFQEGRLADDMTRLISLNANELPDELEAYIDKQIAEGKTGWFDTHPCDRARIASGKKEQAPGVFHLEEPADTLFADFDAVSRRVTLSMYQLALGYQFKESSLRPTDEIVASRESQKRAAQALGSFGQNGWSVFVPIVPPESGLTVNQSDHAALETSRQQIVQLAKDAANSAQMLVDVESKQTECNQASMLVRCGFKIPSDAFSQKLTTQLGIEQVEAVLTEQRQLVQRTYSHFHTAFRNRLWNTLGLLLREDVAAKLPEAPELAAECNSRLFPVLSLQMQHFEKMKEFRKLFHELIVSVNVLQGGAQSEDLFRELKKVCSSLLQRMNELREVFQSMPYPFEHAQEKMMVADYFCKRVRKPDDIGKLYEAANSLHDNFFGLYHRIVSRLCEIACLVEEQFDLEPLPVPEDRKDEHETAA